MSTDPKLAAALDEIAASVTGRAAIMVRGGGWGYEYRGDEVMPAASIIKLLIAVELFRYAAARGLDVDDPVPVEPRHRTPGTGVLARTHSIDRVSLKDLVTLMIIVSDNTATNLLIDTVGMEQINAGAERLGLRQTRLQRKMMDFQPRSRGLDNVSTAAETCTLLEAIWNADGMETSHRDALLFSMREQQFNDKLAAGFPHYFPGQSAFAHKTGEITGVENDAGILDTADGPVFVAVLTADLPSNAHGRDAHVRLGAALTRAGLTT